MFSSSCFPKEGLKKDSLWAWQNSSVIPGCRRLRQVDHIFQTSMAYTVKLYRETLSNKIKQKQQKNPKTRATVVAESCSACFTNKALDFTTSTENLKKTKNLSERNSAQTKLKKE
jgi:hypothetical protein